MRERYLNLRLFQKLHTSKTKFLDKKYQPTYTNVVPYDFHPLANCKFYPAQA